MDLCYKIKSPAYFEVIKPFASRFSNTGYEVGMILKHASITKAYWERCDDVYHVYDKSGVSKKSPYLNMSARKAKLLCLSGHLKARYYGDVCSYVMNHLYKSYELLRKLEFDKLNNK